MKLYQTYASPFPTRVRLALYVKGIEAEIIEPPGFHSSAEAKGDYLRLNPIGRVPTLVIDDGRALPESEVICEYLEDAFPDPPMLPADPWGRAQVRLISRLCDLYLVMAMVPLFTASGQSRRRWDLGAIERAMRAVETALGYLEAFVGAEGYAVGTSLTWADGALVPQLMLAHEWAPALFGGASPLEGYAKLMAYWSAIQRDPFAARILAETREAVAEERERARALAGRP
jgi:glutathione S-transferase